MATMVVCCLAVIIVVDLVSPCLIGRDAILFAQGVLVPPGVVLFLLCERRALRAGLVFDHLVEIVVRRMPVAALPELRVESTHFGVLDVFGLRPSPGS